MTFPEFDKICDQLFLDCLKMRDTKGKEYAGTEDRFANFDRLATTLVMDRKKVLMVYFTKHMDAIQSYIRENREFSTESIHGRIVDAITYLALLDGMIVEEKQTNPAKCTIEEVWKIGDQFRILHTCKTIPSQFAGTSQIVSRCSPLGVQFKDMTNTTWNVEFNHIVRCR